MNLRQLNHRKNDYLRRLKAQGLSRVLDYKNTNSFTTNETRKIKKILFLRNDDKLGDMIILSAAVRELKKQLPAAQISVLAGPKTAPLLAHNPYIDTVHIVTRAWKSVWQTGRQLRREKFDLYVDLDIYPTAQTIFLLYLLRPKYAFGFNRTQQAYNLSVPLDEKNTHISGYYQKLFDALGLVFENKHYEIFLSKESQSAAHHFLQTLPPAHRRVALNAFAASRHRCLCWAQVEKLTAAFPTVSFILLGSADQRKNFVQDRSLPPNLFLPPDTFGLFETLSLLQQCDILVSPDTMWVHAACAFDKPQICLYNREDTVNQIRWAPLSANARVVQAPPELTQLDGDEFVRAVAEFLA